MQTIKNEHLKLVKRIKDDKSNLKSLRYQIDKEDKKQLDYFDNLIKIELGTDYTKLYYQSGNTDNDRFNFYEFGSMINFYQILKTGWITFIKEAMLKLSKFNCLLHMLKKQLLVEKVIKKKRLMS